MSSYIILFLDLGEFIRFYSATCYILAYALHQFAHLLFQGRHQLFKSTGSSFNYSDILIRPYRQNTDVLGRLSSEADFVPYSDCHRSVSDDPGAPEGARLSALPNLRHVSDGS